MTFIFGVDIASPNSEDHSAIVTAERNADGTITILDVQTYDEKVHPVEVPAGE